MGVLACDRNGCSNIMCDRHSYEYGYLCNECFDELVATNPKDIDAFMGNEPKRYSEEEDTYDKFNKMFERR